MNQPLVSVICACYNQSQFIFESLESVKNQAYENLEIIIWDDASQDNSVQIIEGWIKDNPSLKIIFHKHQTNKGICKSLNYAQSKASGKYIQLLALDDLLLSDKISRHVAILEKSNDNDALVFTDALLMNDESILYQNRFISFYKHYFSLNSGNYFDDLLRGNYIPAMSILYKKRILDEIGPWDENLSFEDYDMLLRISKNYNFIFDDQVSAVYRMHAKNTHKTLHKEMKKAEFGIYYKHATYNSDIKKKLLELIEYQYLKKELQGENDQYFTSFPPVTFKQNWIAKNRNVQLYKIFVKINKIFMLLKYN